jgi:ABC-type transport system involved in Fe-S cluster assembly fused permease/ATPase subunit
MFDQKSDWESNTKKVEDILNFLTDIYFSSSDQRFRCYDFLHDDGVFENCNSGQITMLKEK